MSKPHTNPALPADRLHLLPRHREMLVALLREHLPSIEAWAYGSRANGQSHDGSDLDLVLRSPDLQKIPIGQVADFREALRESSIPFLVEARDWARLPKRFHPEIEREYMVLVEKEKRDAASEWPMIRFSDAVQINPPVRLERGKAYPFSRLGPSVSLVSSHDTPPMNFPLSSTGTSDHVITGQTGIRIVMPSCPPVAPLCMSVRKFPSCLPDQRHLPDMSL